MAHPIADSSPSAIDIGTTSSDSKAGGIPSLNDTVDAVMKFQQEAMESIKGTLKIVPPVVEHVERYIKEQQASPPQTTKDVEWLFAVDVTTKSFGYGNNLERRIKEFEALAKETKDKPIAIVLQVANADLGELEKPNSSLYKFFVPTPYHIDRYIIHDGKFQKIDDVNSDGYAGDVSQLLEFSRGHFKAERTGLIIDSHGSGNSGLSGDTGSTSVKDFVSAIKKGQDNGKLDLVDFDACLMAQNGALETLKDVTNHVVASPETEGGIGQDHDKIIRHALETPEIDPKRLAELIVENARLQTVLRKPKPQKPHNIFEFLEQFAREKPKGRDHIPVETLASFDLTEYEQFGKRLDDFGDALTEAIKDPKNRKALESIIDNCDSYDDYWGFAGDLKDLDSFVQDVMDGIADGSLSDPEGKLRIHGGRVRDGHKRIVVSYSGFEYYSSRGGMSVYLPERSFLDFHSKAERRLETSKLAGLCDDVPDLSDDKVKKKFVKQLREGIKSTGKDIDANKADFESWELSSVRKSCERASEAVDRLEKSKGLKKTFEALTDLKSAGKEILRSNYHKGRLIESERKYRADIDEEYKDQMIEDPRGWDKFRMALRHLD